MKSDMSLSSLLRNVLRKSPPEKDPGVSDEYDKKIGTTIRLAPDVKRFYEAKAEQLGGLSLQDVMGMTLTAVMAASDEPQATELELMADRFIEIFTAHGAAVSDIPTMLPRGAIERADLLSRTNLLNKLSPETISHVASLFSVDEQWLKGQLDSLWRGSRPRWYKNTVGFAYRLADLSQHCSSLQVHFVGETGLSLEELRQVADDDSPEKYTPIGVVIQKTVTSGGLSLPTYEVWEQQRWNYWKCRYDLKTMMLFCQKSHVEFSGILVDSDEFKKLFEGRDLAAKILKHPRSVWYPDTFLWDNERNLERHELKPIEERYKESGASQYEGLARSL